MNQAAIDELERQIEATRRALDRTLTALRVELSPRHQLELAWRFAKTRTQRSLRSGTRWASLHPLATSLATIAAAGALYFGTAKLLRRAR